MLCRAVVNFLVHSFGAVGNSFEHMVFLDLWGILQIGYSASHFHKFVVRASGDIEELSRVIQNFLYIIFEVYHSN